MIMVEINTSIMKNKFIELETQLPTIESCNLLHNEIGKESNTLDWKMMLSGTDMEKVIFPEPIISLLNELNGVKLDWEIDEQAIEIPFEKNFPEIVQGRIWLLDPSEMIGMHSMGMWKETLNHHSDSNSNTGDEILLPFDYYFPDYSGCACFRIRNNILEENIVFHSKKFGFYYSQINLDDYLKIILQTKGLLDAREAIFFPESEAREKTIFYCKTLFGDDTLSSVFETLDKKMRLCN